MANDDRIVRSRVHAPNSPLRIGVISDTHGLLRPEAVAELQGTDLIVHAGDVGAPAILEQLRRIAPVYAVRGNNDTGRWAETLPTVRIMTIGAISALVVHDIKAFENMHHRHRLIISGHSHRPRAEERQGVLFVNPGSAGPRRFSLPVSLARLDVDGEAIAARLIDLHVTPTKHRDVRTRRS